MRTTEDERTAAIERFNTVHGNHTHEVSVSIDTGKMMALYEAHYKYRVNIGNYFKTEGKGMTTNMKTELKRDIAARIQGHICSEGITQKTAAELIGCSQPRVSDLMNLRVDKFSVDSLLDAAVALGVRIRIRL